MLEWGLVWIGQGELRRPVCLDHRDEGYRVSSKKGRAQIREGLTSHAEDLVLTDVENQWCISAGELLI